ncbi:hypothetical protein C7999DRAFT_32524 [Corynascus novoguineensis]|uniref:Peptidase C14 caspase domain-containing protein n=1 Tax=Corynascus novoguineensis TaxID=1126955 RepID=A0AAN7HEX7_9PEZI|nr:hypothetical protein C7999DRAFT_32524 [Corynascus novoguineensis]
MAMAQATRYKSHESVSRHAILVGIDAYDTENFASLKGCVNDVNKISELLESSVDNLSIHRLTASRSGSSKLPTEPNHQWPTPDKLKSCFEVVHDKTKRGDHVYFHFSGHGILEAVLSRPEIPQHWALGEYLALVLLKGMNGFTFHSAELAQWMKRLIGKGVSVTVVLDCCRSGGTLRGGKESDDTLHPALSGGTTEPLANIEMAQSMEANGDYTSSHGMRGVSMDVNWLVNPKGYAILAASDRTEGAYHAKFANSSLQYGLLTYFLIETFRDLGGVGGPMEQLFQSISVKVKDNRRLHTKTQNPVLKGNGKLLFFGCSIPHCGGDFPVTRVVDAHGLQVAIPGLRLHAGRAHGVVENDQFILHPLETGVNSPAVTVEAFNVRGVTSDLRVVGHGRPVTGVLTGWMATTLADVQAALKSRPSLAEYYDETEDGAQTSGWTFKVTQPCPKAYAIHDSENSHQALTTLSSIAEPSERVIQRLLDQIEHLARFKLLRGLTHKPESSRQQPFWNVFSVQLVKDYNSKFPMIINPGCRLNEDWLAACFHSACDSECVTKVLSGETLVLRVENKEAENGQSLYFYVYDMAADWEVVEVHGSTRLEVPSGKLCEKGVQFNVEDGQDKCEDVLKIFLTRQSTSFRPLTMPPLGQSPDPHMPESAQYRGDYRSEDWSVVTFRLAVSRN